ncbi:BclA C-terminal domain-containing protein [Bacillaceae bacterium C204]|uniref:BclA C-terminal domain-containing protein n=1 Tax=Neobacillus sp. 204 TaxID=3383351 RepID=UPI00397CABCA
MSDKNCKKSSAAYGYFTLVGTEPILVGPNENIRFNQHSSLKKIRFSQNSNTLTVLKSGDYKIEFTLLIDGPASTSVYSIFLNHSSVPGNLTNFGIKRQVDNATLMLVGQAIIHVPKNSTIELRNIGTATDTLLPILGNNRINAASLSIVKLS